LHCNGAPRISAPRTARRSSANVPPCCRRQYFPWNIQAPLNLWGDASPTASLPTISFADISAAGGPADQWDALPTAGKVQILLVIGFLEMCAPSP
jgi:hypothetical protein